MSKIKNNLRKNVYKLDVSLSARNSRIFSEIVYGDYLWNRKIMNSKVIDLLTKQDLTKFASNLFIKNKMVAIWIYGNKNNKELSESEQHKLKST
jgi:secreted Zn-dependent insulinase-like peptidase